MGIMALMPWSATAACCALTDACSSACRIRLPSPRARITAFMCRSEPRGGGDRRLTTPPLPPHGQDEANQPGGRDDEQDRPHDSLSGSTVQEAAGPEQRSIHDETSQH